MKTKCVIFDLDGVLVDTVEAWMKIHREAAKKFVPNPPADEEIDKLVYTPTSEFVDRLLPENIEMRDKIARKMHDYIQNHMEDMITSSCVKEKEGARDLLRKLKQEKIKIGLVTNNEKKFTKQVISHFALQKFFDAVITKDDVKNTKPHPEPLLKAIEQLGCPLENCIYIGDTEADVIAGKLAGIITVLFYGTQKKVMTAPDFTIKKLNEILALIK